MNAAESHALMVMQENKRKQTLRKWLSSSVMFCALCVIALIAVPMLLLGCLIAAVWWCADRLIRLLESQ